MKDKQVHMVTGAFGFTGKYIAGRLLDQDHQVSTLTNSPNRQNDLTHKVKAVEFNFDNPGKLVKSLENVSTLYNTYWVRFNHKRFSHQDAVENTLTLFAAAQEAGVRKIVHTSITNPSLDSDLEYFHGKAVLEQALIKSGIPYSILRPAVIFGKEDILINNIAWLLRKMPVFPIFGYGSYCLQPIYVKDFADLAIKEGLNNDSVIIDAIGPETYSYRSLVEKIGDIIGISKPIVSVSPKLGYLVGSFVGKLVKDVVVTKEEIEGLMSDLLCVKSDPVGTTSLSKWAYNNRLSLGIKYSSELARRIDRTQVYA